MADIIQIKIEGLEKLQANFARLSSDIETTVGAAGAEAAKIILSTQGLRKYPPSTAANQPPTPYYIRGRGMQYKTRNNGKSERLGTQFYVDKQAYTTIIGNRASYAPYVVGDQQAGHMGRIGWRKLSEVAVERIGDITKIFQAWIDRLIRKNNL